MKIHPQVLWYFFHWVGVCVSSPQTWIDLVSVSANRMWQKWCWVASEAKLWKPPNLLSWDTIWGQTTTIYKVTLPERPHRTHPIKQPADSSIKWQPLYEPYKKRSLVEPLDDHSTTDIWPQLCKRSRMRTAQSTLCRFPTHKIIYRWNCCCFASLSLGSDFVAQHR